jgi:hypothetical protein
MILKRVILIKCLVSLIVFLSFGSVLSQGDEETLSFSGVIKEISRDYQSMVVNEKKFSIPRGAKVFNQQGKALRIDELRSNLDVAIDAIRHGNAFMIKKIVVVEDRGV